MNVTFGLMVGLSIAMYFMQRRPDYRLDNELHDGLVLMVSKEVR